MIAANERKASRFRLATFLATVAILRTFQYDRDIIGKVNYGRALLDFDGTCKSLAKCGNSTENGIFFDGTRTFGLVRISYVPVHRCSCT